MDDATIKLIRALLCETQPSCSGPWEVGQKYLIRTVTNYWTGRLVSYGTQELVLDDAAWVADTGRFHEADSTGTLNEVEPVDGKVIVARGSVVDAVVWKHNLPRSQK